MKPIPWRRVQFWACVRCGKCCSLTVQLTIGEWLDLTKRYGQAIISQELGRFFLVKTIDDECPFLSKSAVGWLCKLQHIKPMACKMWPFRVLTEPKYGQVDEACFLYRKRRYYVYAMPFCQGITWGRPTEYFIKRTMPEFIDILIGLQKRQYFTTSS